MNQPNCTCTNELCPYCRCEQLRLERLHREVESFAAMKATVGVKVKPISYRRGPYRTRLVQYGQKLEAA